MLPDTLKPIEIPEVEYNRTEQLPEGAGVDEVRFHAQLSPFNMPTTMKLGTDPRDACLAVWLTYNNEEPEDRHTYAFPNLRLTIGKNSGKVLRVGFADPVVIASSPDPPRISASVLGATLEKLQGSKQFVFRRTCDIANQVLRNAWPQVQPQLLKLVAVERSGTGGSSQEARK